jgi:DNA-binding transcriptional LysR family regulator
MVAKNLSFSHSAENLCLSQSSLSKYIQSLEKELSVKLFNRSTRMIKLTEAGKYLSLHAAKILDEYEKALSGISAYVQDNSQSLAIAAIPVIAQYGISKMIAIYSEKNRYINIKLSEMDVKPVLNALEMKEIDIGIIRGQRVPDDNYKRYPLMDDELVLVTNEKHRFAERPVVNLAEAATEQFVLLNENTFTHKVCVEACEEAGFFPNYKRMKVTIGTICSFVEHGAGVALLMEKTVAGIQNPELRIVRLEQHPVVTISIVVRNEPLSPICEDFIKFASDYFKFTDKDDEATGT